MRAGAHALSLLSVPLNVHVLQALAEESRPLIDLRRAVGSPPQTTMRGHLRGLTEQGILERRRQVDFPGCVDYELAAPGRELLVVAEVLQSWLADSPDGPLLLGSPAAKSTIKALVDGWNSTIVRALAARPLALTDLNRLISALNYPSLERRLVAMRQTGLIDPCTGKGRGTPYVITPWLRRAIGPLASAAVWERRRAANVAPPVGRLDVEASFLLAAPLLELPEEVSASCRMVAEIGRDGSEKFAGVMVEIDEGSVASCISRLDGRPHAWATGSVSAWLDAVISGEVARLDLGGDRDLARLSAEGLHKALFRYALDAR